MPFPCTQCVAVSVNGVPCHEAGCPDAWRDYARLCNECGCTFTPGSRFHVTCPDCVRDLCPQVDDEDSDARESAADRRTRWEEQGRPLDPAADERESSLDDDQRGGGPDSD